MPTSERRMSDRPLSWTKHTAWLELKGWNSISFDRAKDIGPHRVPALGDFILANLLAISGTPPMHERLVGNHSPKLSFWSNSRDGNLVRRANSPSTQDSTFARLLNLEPKKGVINH